MTHLPARPHTRPLMAALVLVALSGASVQALAGQAYANAGFPGLMVGYAQAVNDLVTLRADYATLGSQSKNGVQEGIEYKGKAKISRVGLFADYFPLGNSFRLTGGLTLNDVKVNLRSNFQTGTTVNVGGTNVPVTSSDYFNVEVKFPKVTPYVGVGWGLQDQAPGWGFVGDLGVSVGKAKVAVDTNVKDKGVSQADIDRETQELRDGVGKVRVLPQLTVGVSYRY